MKSAVAKQFPRRKQNAVVENDEDAFMMAVMNCPTRMLMRSEVYDSQSWLMQHKDSNDRCYMFVSSLLIAR